MLDPITVLILKVVASACIRFYLTSLMGAGPITYDTSELGYTIPKWYMDPGKPRKEFYAYGTSVVGDEFESIEDARRRAIDQMARHIRLSNRAMIEKQVRYDANSIKQRRLIELFIRGDGLEPFIRMNAKLDKKELVAVAAPRNDIRAFVRIKLKLKTYLKYQEQKLNDLKTRLTQQKSDDILAEMEAEKAAWEQEAATLPPGMLPGLAPNTIAPPATVMPTTPAVQPPVAPVTPPFVSPDDMPSSTAQDPWGDLEDELDESK